MNYLNRHLVFCFVITIIILSKNKVECQINFSEDNEFSNTEKTSSLDDDYYYSDEGVEVEELTSNGMTAEDQILECGKADRCLGNTLMKKLKDYKNLAKSYDSCRCDRQLCSKYGDCCIGIVLNSTKSNELEVRKEGVTHQPITANPKVWKNPWRCNFLHHKLNDVWALMISECPNESKNFELNSLCSKDNEAVSRFPNSKYLLDVPVYNNQSGLLYRNIFCARCHNERIEHILKFRLQLLCNKEFTSEELIQFQKEATYTQDGSREWKTENTTCQLLIDEFSTIDDVIKTIPNIRFCKNATDSCPKNGLNVTERIQNLCSSYTQYVTKDKVVYKNPHCYLCQSHESEPLPTCGLGFFRFFNQPGKHNQIDGAGLNFLFDFKFFDDNQYVGYEMLCKESEVWDYVRHDCHPMICGKNHILINGVCEIKDNNSTFGDGRNDLMDDDDDEPKENLSKDPDCFRILISDKEYTILHDMNNTIKINLSTGGWIYLNEAEYDIWNETTVSICAKYLHHAFQSRFSPIFNYLSVALMGLSIFFLFIHIFLYILLPKMRNLPAKNLFCLALCLCFSQFILLIFITATENHSLCIVAAMSIHYLFLGAFFWMSSMSFDIWRTFSGQCLLAHGRSRRGGSFLKYSIFSWGGPLIIVSLAAVADFGGLEYNLIDNIKPAYGQTGLCWISQRFSLFIFFALPVAIAIFSNLILFSLTARAILIQNKESNTVLSKSKDSAKSSKNNSDEMRLKLYVKLAIIMGLTWILGFISAFLLWDWLWYAFVILNGLQGTFIFFTFDFKKRTLGLIYERLGWKNRKESTLTTASGGSGPASRGRSTSTTSLGNRISVIIGDINGIIGKV